MTQATKKTKRMLSAFLAIIMAVICMTCAAIPASAASNYYSKTMYPVKTSGLVYAKDQFSFSVDNGRVTLHSVYQSSGGYPKLGYSVSYYGGSYMKVNTYWGSNPSIKLWKWYLPTFKTVTCHYTIYSNGNVVLDYKS